MIKNDTWIKEQAELGMIQPFQPTLVREVVLPGHAPFGHLEQKALHVGHGLL